MRAPAGRLRVIVLGAGAGGGSPQWNCRCEVCEAVRSGVEGTSRRTQTALAVSSDGKRWVVINASPDLGEQLLRTEALHPSDGLRSSPISAVVLTGAEIDQCAGLLHLREGHSFSLYGSDGVHETLGKNQIFTALSPERVPRRSLPLEESTEVLGPDGEGLGIYIESFPVAGKIPLYEEGASTPDLDVVSDRTLGLRISSGGFGGFFFVPCCAVITPELSRRLKGAGGLFFDGTLYEDRELINAGLSHKTGRRMGHVSIGGPEGSLAGLRALGIERKIFLHINNSNPILLPRSEARREVEAAGWEVAYDSMEFRW